MSGETDPAHSTCQHIEPLLSAYVDTELPGGTRHHVEAHLATCARCRADVAELARTRALLASLPTRRLPEPVGADLVVSARGTTGVRAGVAVVAIAASAALGAAFSLGGQPDDGRVVSVPVEAFVSGHLVQAQDSIGPGAGARP